MTAELINNWATVPAVIAGVGALAVAIVYGIGSPWWKSPLGVAFLGVTVSGIFTFIIVYARRFFGLYPGYEWVALFGYSGIALVWWGMFVVILRERRGDGHVTFRVKKEKRK